jgi:glycosyltransferase involved in cell wall biosynthesis
MADLSAASDAAKLHLVRTGIVPATFPDRPDDDPDLVARLQAAEPLRVLFVGRLVPEKRPLDVVQALVRMRDRGVPVSARIVGDGPLAESVRVAVIAGGLQADVELVGPQSEAEIPPHYAWADVLCLPSAAEGLPVVLMEALASCLPVVTTRIAAIPELVEDGTNGLLIETGDVMALTAKLSELARDPHRRVRMGRAGRDRVLQDYDATTNALRLGEIFTRLTASTPAEPGRTA